MVTFDVSHNITDTARKCTTCTVRVAQHGSMLSSMYCTRLLCACARTSTIRSSSSTAMASTYVSVTAPMAWPQRKYAQSHPRGFYLPTFMILRPLSANHSNVTERPSRCERLRTTMTTHHARVLSNHARPSQAFLHATSLRTNFVSNTSYIASVNPLNP